MSGCTIEYVYTYEDVVPLVQKEFDLYEVLFFCIGKRRGVYDLTWQGETGYDYTTDDFGTRISEEIEIDYLTVWFALGVRNDEEIFVIVPRYYGDKPRQVDWMFVKPFREIVAYLQQTKGEIKYDATMNSVKLNYYEDDSEGYSSYKNSIVEEQQEYNTGS